MLDIKNEYFTLSVDLSDCTLTPKEKEVIRLLLAGYDVITGIAVLFVGARRYHRKS